MQFTRLHVKQILLLLLLSLPKHLVGGDYLDTFLPAMLPPLSKHHKYYSARCLSHTSKLAWQRHYFLMAVVEMTAWHVGTGFLHVNGKNEHGYQSCQPLQELDSARGLFTYDFFPSWQWRKQSERNTAATGWNLAHLICAGPTWAFWSRTVWAESAIWNSWVPEARSVFPYLKGQYKIPLCLEVKARAWLPWRRCMLSWQCSPKAWCLQEPEGNTTLLQRLVKWFIQKPPAEYTGSLGSP